MKENKNSDEHGTHWAANILYVRWKNWQEMVRKPRTNYINIVFANKMFASVYAALEITECVFMTVAVYFDGGSNFVLVLAAECIKQ